MRWKKISCYNSLFFLDQVVCYDLSVPIWLYNIFVVYIHFLLFYVQSMSLIGIQKPSARVYFIDHKSMQKLNRQGKEEKKKKRKLHISSLIFQR